MRHGLLRAAIAGLVLALLPAVPRVAGADEDGAATYAGRDATWWVGELKERNRAPAAYVAFQQIGEPALAPLAAALEDPDGAFRERVMRAIRATPGDKTKILERILGAIDDQSSGVVQVALEILREMGPQALRGLPVLVAHLREPTWAHAYMGMGVVGAMGEAAATAEDVLLFRIQAGRPIELQAACEALAQVVPRSKRAVAALAAAYDGAEPAVRQRVLRGLARFDPALPGVMETIGDAAADPEGAVRRAATDALSDLAPRDPRAAPLLLRALTDADIDIVWMAARGLKTVPEQAVEGIPTLIGLLASTEHRRAEAAAGLLGEMATRTDLHDALRPAIPALLDGLGKVGPAELALLRLLPESLPAIVEALGQGDANRRRLAFGIIERVPADALRPHAVALTRSLAALFAEETGPNNTSYRALELLARLGPEPPEVLTLLLSLASHPDPSLRHNLAIRLAQMPAAREALVEMLGSASIDERNLAWQAMQLWRGPEDLTPDLVRLLRHPQEDVRWRAAERLLPIASSLVEGREDLVLVLRAWMRSPSTQRRRTALYGLQNLVPEAAAAWEELHLLLGDRDVLLATEASRVLAGVSPPGGRNPVTILRRDLDAEDPEVSAGAALGLAHLEDDPAVLVPRLRRLLEPRRPEAVSVLLKAVAAVRRMGPAAADLVPELVALVRRRAGAPIGEAAMALVQLAPGNPETLACLVDLLRDRAQPMRAAAAYPLALLGDAALEPLAAALDDPDPAFLVQVLAALGSMRQVARPVRDRIDAMRAHPEADVRRTADVALGQIPQ